MKGISLENDVRHSLLLLFVLIWLVRFCLHLPEQNVKFPKRTEERRGKKLMTTVKTG